MPYLFRLPCLRKHCSVPRSTLLEVAYVRKLAQLGFSIDLVDSAFDQQFCQKRECFVFLIYVPPPQATIAKISKARTVVRQMKTLGKAKKLVKAEAKLAKLKAKEVRLAMVVVVALVLVVVVVLVVLVVVVVLVWWWWWWYWWC